MAGGPESALRRQAIQVIPAPIVTLAVTVRGDSARQPPGRHGSCPVTRIAPESPAGRVAAPAPWAGTRRSGQGRAAGSRRAYLQPA